jgi:hypothetical protein
MAICLSQELELNGSMFCIGDGYMLYFWNVHLARNKHMDIFKFA